MWAKPPKEGGSVIVEGISGREVEIAHYLSKEEDL
jgi:hypothetical protein